jgi:hypothetical protein
MKELCKSCEHLNTDRTRITNKQDCAGVTGKANQNDKPVGLFTVHEPDKRCSFKNISLHNCNPLSSCNSYSVSELANPEDKYKAINL